VTPMGHPVENRKRTKVVSTSGGYLNQNEYVLHFALPVDPDPDPDKDVRFRVSVDFKGIAAQQTVRVDRHVNPVLGDLDLAQLDDREIVVYRSGRVRIHGCDYLPAAPAQPLATVNGGLVLAGVDAPIAPVVPAPGGDWFVGMEIDTALATAPQRIEEVVIDGALAPAVDCSGVPANFFVWDVTDPANPALASDGMRDYVLKPQNDRNYYPLEATLEPGRVYRLAMRVTELRGTPIAGPIVDGPFTTTGGLSFQDAAPCSGAAIAAATVDATQLFMTVRFRDEPPGAWADLGNALAGTGGAPTLTMTGSMRAGTVVTASIDDAFPDAPTWLVLGFTATCIPLFDGMLVPWPDIVLAGLSTDSAGHLSFDGDVETDVASGESFFIQALILDPGAPDGVAMTNAVSGTTPF
jgi:hypothetical protein